jgi:DNA invertase Pin-like site-specific DNA recombinase
VEVDRVFTDRASGKDIVRPQLEALVRLVRDGDTVVVHSLDWLARNLDDLRRLVSGLTARGVSVCFVHEQLTFTGEDSPMASLLLTVMGAFAEFERDLIRERQREGIALAKAQGAYRGRGRSLTEEQIDAVVQRAAAGEPKALLAREFDISRDRLPVPAGPAHRRLTEVVTPVWARMRGMPEPDTPTTSAVYQLRVVLREISPIIWRRLLVGADTTLAGLHEILQVAFGWSGEHLHRFVIHGADYDAHDLRAVRLVELRLRETERFVYDYDFTGFWRHDIRVEQILAGEPAGCYPRCTGGPGHRRSAAAGGRSCS